MQRNRHRCVLQRGFGASGEGSPGRAGLGVLTPPLKCWDAVGLPARPICRRRPVEAAEIATTTAETSQAPPRPHQRASSALTEAAADCLPVQTCANVLVDSRALARKTVCDSMQFPHLLEQRLELVVVERHSDTRYSVGCRLLRVRLGDRVVSANGDLVVTAAERAYVVDAAITDSPAVSLRRRPPLSEPTVELRWPELP